MNYQEIGLQYGIIVHKVERGDKWWKVNGPDAYLNESACAGRDEIWVGVYDNKDEEIAAFFHELGHCISTNLKDFHHTEFDKFHMELDAWIVGLTEAYKYKYLMEPSTFRYMVKCLESYIGWEEREIKGFNTKEKQIMWKDVKNELPSNTFECIVKMWNNFNDTWVTGIGIYDIPTEKWEVSSNLGEQYPVHFWFQTPELMTGIGIYDVPTEKQEVSSNLGEQFEVK